MDHFLRRRVRRRKYSSDCKRGICVPAAHKLCARRAASLLGTEREPSNAVRVRKGATTQWMRPAACGGAKDTEFVATQTQRSGFRLSALEMRKKILHVKTWRMSRKGRATPIITCTKRQVGRLCRASLLPTSATRLCVGGRPAIDAASTASRDHNVGLSGIVTHPAGNLAFNDL